MPSLNASRAARRRMPYEIDELVAALLAQHNRAMAAYDIAAAISRGRKKISGTQAYRALDRLMRDGRVRRLEGLNAYCSARPGFNAVIYCRACRTFIEVPFLAIHEMLLQEAETMRFKAGRAVIEVSGICAECRSGQTEAL